MMLVVERKTDAKDISDGGQADQGTADRPPGAFEASTPVATMVTKMATMMEQKSMYPRMANSWKVGGSARK